MSAGKSHRLMEANSKAKQAEHLLKQAKHDLIELDNKNHLKLASVP